MACGSPGSRSVVSLVMVFSTRRRLSLPAFLLSGAGLLGVATLRVWQLPGAVAEAHVNDRAQGSELFATSGCAHCHGKDGMGTEKGPSLRNVRKKLSADKVRGQIAHGGDGMPPFGDVLSAAQVDSLVRFLRAKNWVSAPPPVVTPAPPS